MIWGNKVYFEKGVNITYLTLNNILTIYNSRRRSCLVT